MSCAVWQEAISARADGEASGVDHRLLDAHLARCAGCRAFEAAAAANRRELRLRPAEPMPDLASRVARLDAAADRASRWGLVRALLAVVALEVVIVAAPSLVLGDSSGDHDARHLGAFSVAYAIALAVVVARPARARAVLPVAGFLALAITLSALVDLASGSAPLGGELTHLPEIASLPLVWLLTIRARPRGGRRRAVPLRVVEHPDVDQRSA